MRLPSFVVLGIGASLLCVTPLRAQSSMQDDQLRIGITIGSTSFVGLSVEYFFDERRSIDLNLGTWSLRDISTSVVVKQYAGGGGARAYLGLGLWNVFAWQEEGFGGALIVRAPIGLEFEPFDKATLGADISVSRAVWVNRADPEDKTPPASRLVPLPGFYFKWAARDR